LIDSVPKALAQITAGSFGYRRIFGMDSTRAGDGRLLIAGEAGTYDGPWVNPDDMRKLNGMVRYSQGAALDGFSVTGMAYSNRWNSTDQVPQRAITAGQIGLYGSEDLSDGGNTNRFALSGRMAGTDDAGPWKANAFVVKSQLDLFNDLTYFLNNPVLGDQFHQHDDRIMAGANASRSLNGSLAGLPMQMTVGIQTRYDDIDLALTDTFQRGFLANVRSDKVGEASIGVYAQNMVQWTEWLRTTIGWRGDYYQARVNSIFDANMLNGNSKLIVALRVQRRRAGARGVIRRVRNISTTIILTGDVSLGLLKAGRGNARAGPVLRLELGRQAIRPWGRNDIRRRFGGRWKCGLLFWHQRRPAIEQADGNEPTAENARWNRKPGAPERPCGKRDGRDDPKPDGHSRQRDRNIVKAGVRHLDRHRQHASGDDSGDEQKP
jgi:hypothetical protein